MKFKRLLSIICILVILVSSVPIQILAAETTDKPVVTIESDFACVGQTVDIDVSISGNTGIFGAILTFEFPAQLELKQVTNGNAFADLDISLPDSLTSPYTVFYDGAATPSTTDGVIITMSFLVTDTAVADTLQEIKVSYLEGDVTDSNLQDLDIDIVNGGINVIDYIPGDVNGDTRVNTVDVTLIRRYRMGGYDLGTFNEMAADVNDDGRINTVDVTLIRRFRMGGYGVVLIPSTHWHTHALIAVAEKPASCTADGNIAYWQCSRCKKYFSDAAAKNEITYADILIPCGHTEVVDSAVAPTYTSTGMTEGKHCSVCHIVLVEQTAIPMLKANYHFITYVYTPEKSVVAQYAEQTGLQNLLVPERVGYGFLGWYTEPDGGGNRIPCINKGDTTDHILYAHWELSEYTLYTYYSEEYQPIDSIKYTVKNEFMIATPKWSGLKFANWTDNSGKIEITESNGTYVAKLRKGTTGNISLIANWKTLRNLFVPATGVVETGAVYDETTNRYYFAYNLGTITGVVLDTIINPYEKSTSIDYTMNLSRTVGVTESSAQTMAQTVAQSVMQSSTWGSVYELMNSATVGEHLDCSLGIKGGIKDTFETSLLLSFGVEASVGMEETYIEQQGGSEEASESVSSSISYSTEYSISSSQTETVSITIPGSLPNGRYCYVHTGDIRVFAFVAYDPVEERYYLKLHSLLDNSTSGTVLYYRNVNDIYNNVCDAINFNIPTEEIQAQIDSSYYVQYDANGGEGEMNLTIMGCGREQHLSSNQFEKAGYTFSGWELRNESGTTLYGNAQSVCDIAAGGETITLYAVWTANEYTVTFNANRGNISTSSKKVIYDSAYGELPIPQRTGYDFIGWSSANGNVTETTIVKIADNHTLTALWTPRTDTRYVVRHYQMNVSGSGYTLVKEQAFVGTTNVLVTPVVNQYTGFTSPMPQTKTIEADGSMVIEYRYNRNTYNVYYDSKGGTPVNTQTYYYGATINNPENPTRAGYTFYNWCSELNGVGFGSSMPAQSFTIIALWDIVTSINTTKSPGVIITDNIISGLYEMVLYLDSLDTVELCKRYSKVTVTVTFNGTEKQKGYQELFLICDTSKITVDLFDSLRFEGDIVGEGVVYKDRKIEIAGKALGTETITRVSTVASSSWYNNYVYFVFGANGAIDDDWILNSYTITVKYHD